MDILPAIDILDGEVVRLAQGDYDRPTAYDDDPVAAAGRLFELGAGWIHVVDLDAARRGRPTNTEPIRRICEAAEQNGVRVQCGGGIRTRNYIDVLLALGAGRLVIGSAALKDWEWFEDILQDEHYPKHRLALGLDARGGYVAAEGWTDQLETPALEFARRVKGSGLGAVVYTDIARDGMLTGVNLDATAGLIAATDVPVIASGGIASLDDVRRCRQIGCAGVIIGRAYYEGKIDLAKAFEIS